MQIGKGVEEHGELHLDALAAGRQPRRHAVIHKVRGKQLIHHAKIVPALSLIHDTANDRLVLFG
jgi:hypothetical protein